MHNSTLRSATSGGRSPFRPRPARDPGNPDRPGALRRPVPLEPGPWCTSLRPVRSHAGALVRPRSPGQRAGREQLPGVGSRHADALRGAARPVRPADRARCGGRPARRRASGTTLPAPGCSLRRATRSGYLWAARCRRAGAGGNAGSRTGSRQGRGSPPSAWAAALERAGVDRRPSSRYHSPRTAPGSCLPGGSSSVGRASAFQAECRGFETRLPLQIPHAQKMERSGAARGVQPRWPQAWSHEAPGSRKTGHSALRPPSWRSVAERATSQGPEEAGAGRLSGRSRDGFRRAGANLTPEVGTNDSVRPGWPGPP